MLNINLVNTDTLERFVSNHIVVEVGKNKYTGKVTTLEDEIGEIYRMVGIAEAKTVNYYNARKAYASVERNADEEREYRAHKWLDAGKKILFLNAVCKKMDGGYFVTQHLATESVSDMMDVAMAFVDALDEIVRDYEEV